LPPPDASTRIARSLDDLTAARSATTVTTRAQAMQQSVCNRARDVVVGVISALPLTRIRERGGGDPEDLGPGWLRRPDPDHTLGYFLAWVTDDLYFNGYAYARVTSRDTDDQPNALQWLPFAACLPVPVDGVAGWPTSTGRYVALPGQSITYTTPGGRQIPVDSRDLVIFESPLTGVLGDGSGVLSTAARLDQSADRFAASTIPAGWLTQTEGEDLTADELAARADAFAVARLQNAIAATNRYFEYHESTLDPSRLQLVEGRAYQDAAVARVCNVPNFVVGVGVPNDSMTYKTALTARLDLVSFALSPYLTCWQQTLSAENVTPRGTRVEFDLETFLQTSLLGQIGGTGVAAPADVAPVPATPNPGG